MATRKIIQIIPADDWYVAVPSVGESASGRTLWRLACWALVEKENGETEVVGMEAQDDVKVHFADEGNFAGYYHEKGIRTPADEPPDED